MHKTTITITRTVEPAEQEEYQIVWPEDMTYMEARIIDRYALQAAAAIAEKGRLE